MGGGTADDDLATAVGALIGILFYTCVVLGCARAFQCWWLLRDDFDDAGDDAEQIAPLHGHLLPHAVVAGEEEIIMAREAVTMREPAGEDV